MILNVVTWESLIENGQDSHVVRHIWDFLVCVNVQKVVKTMNPAQNFIILVPNVSLIEKTQILKFLKVFSLGKVMGFWAGFTILNTFCTSVYIFDTP